jgi:Bacterial PH domain
MTRVFLAPQARRRRRWDDGGVSERAVFRIPPLTILGAVLLAVCATPVAFGAPWFWLVYLLPVAVVVWVLRVRTTVDEEALTVRRLIGSRRVPWSQIRSLHLRDKGGVRAVLTDGAELPLPSVRVRDLPQLAAASGGRLSLGDE